MIVKKQDSPLSLLFRDNSIAKDLINHVLAFPEEIHAEDLSEGDTRETGKYETGLKSFFRTRYRDVLKQVKSGKRILIVGMENQQRPNPIMTLRVLEGEVLDYLRQYSDIRMKHRREWKDENGKSHKPKGIDFYEYKEGFLWTDRLIPVTTIVLYWGRVPWRGPRHFKGILDDSEDVRTIDLEMYVLDVCRMSDEEINTWDMDLRTVFWFTKYAQDMDKLLCYMKENKNYVENVPELIYDAIESTTGSKALKLLKSKMITEEGEVIMKSGIDKWGDARERAGRKQGKAEGKEEQARSMVLSMVKENIDISVIARVARKKASTIRKWIEEDKLQTAQVK